MLWVSSLLLSLGCQRQAPAEAAAAEPAAPAMWDKCPGELPPGFEGPYRTSAMGAFEDNFRRSLSFGVVQSMGVPEGWDREAFLAFTDSWWGQALAQDIDEVGNEMIDRSLAVVRDGPLCARMAEISVGNPDRAVVNEVMNELREAVSPLQFETAQLMQQRITPERRDALMTDFQQAIGEKGAE